MVSFILSLTLVILFRYIHTLSSRSINSKIVIFCFFAAKEKSEFRLLINYYFFCWKTIKENSEKLKKYYRYCALLQGKVHEFHCDHTRMNDPRLEHPDKVITVEIVNKIEDIVLDEHWVKIHDIAKDINTTSQWCPRGYLTNIPQLRQKFHWWEKSLSQLFGIHSVIFDYLDKGKRLKDSIISLYWIDFIIHWWKKDIWQRKIILFHHDNRRANRSATEMTKILDLCYKQLPHSPYSPDLGRYDTFSSQTWRNGLMEED